METNTGAILTKPALTKKKLEMVTALYMAGPYVLLMLVFTIAVFVMGAMMSLTDAARLDPGTFTGIQNYIDVISNPKYWTSVWTTLQYTVFAMLVQIPIAFVLAYILNNIKSRFRAVLRASFFIPVLINNVVIALLFRMLFSGDYGIINWAMGTMGLPNNTEWVKNPNLVIPMLVIVSSWQWMGFHAVYFLANLQTIDRSLFEAAKLDGASPLRVLFQIVFPMVRPAFTFVMITSAIGCLQLFDLVFLLFPDAGYVGGTARTIIAYIYDEAFSQQARFGYASAAGFVSFFMILIVSLFQLRFLGLGKAEE